MGGVFLTKHVDAMDSYRIVYGMQMQSGIFWRVVFLAVAVCYIVTLTVCYKDAKRKMAECDIENEQQYERLEKRIEGGLAVCSIGYLLLLLFFGLEAGAMTDIKKRAEMPWILFSAVVFVGSLVVLCFFQNRFVELTKELYPEKMGSIYDIKFQKTWMQSCDEAEKLMVYQVCYKVFMIMSRVYSAAALVFFVLSVVFGIGSLVFMTIMVLWLISQGVYFYVNARIEKNIVQ